MAISVGESLLPHIFRMNTHHLLRPTVVLVGNAQSWLPELCERAKKLSVNQGFEKGADL